MMLLPLLLATAFTAPASPPHAPPEIVVVWRTPVTPADLHRANEGSLRARVARLGLEWRGSLADHLAPGSPARTTFRGAMRGGTATMPPQALPFDPARVWLLRAGDDASAADAVAALRGDPDVVSVEPEHVREPAALDRGFPNDPLFSRQWGLANLGLAAGVSGVRGADIGAIGAWSRSVGSNDLLLAVADSGIDPEHPELAGLMPDGRPRLDHPVSVAFGDFEDAYADSFGHGTPVAGVMAARTNDGPRVDSLGVAGVCGGDGQLNAGCRLMPIKITRGNSGFAYDVEIAAAVIRATDAGARAINISFAGEDPSFIERTALRYAVTNGCIPVCAAGNRGAVTPTRAQYPAAFASEGLCIQVGASDTYDHRVVFSSYGPGLDLLAPGVEIWTTFMRYPSANGASYAGYVVDAGTSFAAPFVTGAVGLLAAARPDLTDDDFQHVLRITAHDIGAPGVDAETGWGRLDASAALAYVDSTLGIWHGEVAAQSVVPAEIGDLITSDNGDYNGGFFVGRAQRFEVSATVAIPDSFLGVPHAWVRVAGTNTARDGFQLSYFVGSAQVASVDRSQLIVRGSVYQRIIEDCPDCSEPGYVPVDPTNARIAFTVAARVDRPPHVQITGPAALTTVGRGDSVTVRWDASDPDEVTRVQVWLDETQRTRLLTDVPGSARSAGVQIPCEAAAGPASLRVVALDLRAPHYDANADHRAIAITSAPCASRSVRLAAYPTPFSDRTLFSGPAGAEVRVLDITGRLVRRLQLDGIGGRAAWDGADEAGHAVPPGVYLARMTGSSSGTLRLARLR